MHFSHLGVTSGLGIIYTSAKNSLYEATEAGGLLICLFLYGQEWVLKRLFHFANTQ